MQSKKNSSKLQPSLVFHSEHLVDLTSGLEVEIKSLSYKVFYNINTKYTKLPNLMKYHIAAAGLITPKITDIPTAQDIEEIASKIIELTIPEVSIYDATDVILNIIKEDTFKEDTFNDCDLCKEKGMDKLRNCPLLHEETHDSLVFYLIGDKKYKECPMNEINSTPIRRSVIEIFNAWNNKMLPEYGGIVDQTVYFYNTAAMITSKLKQPNPLEDL